MTDGVLWVGLALLVATFGLGRRRLTATPGGRRFLHGYVGVLGWVGVGALVVALAPPVDRLATELLVVHMAQHLGLLLLVAPCLAAGRAVAVFGAALPRDLRERRRPRAADRWLRPLLAAGLLAVVWWAWHVPTLYAAAQRTPVLHGLEHTTMLGAAWLFWTVVLDAARRAEPGAAVAAVFLTGLHMTAMGAALAFTAEPWLGMVAGGGIDDLLDQRLAGGLLWFPGGLVWIATGTSLVWRWFREDERRVAAADAATGNATQ